MDSIKEGAIYKALCTHKALALPPANPQQAEREQGVLRKGPSSHRDSTQREEPGPGAVRAMWERSDFILVLTQGTSQQPTN